jgi:hypothetical protein
LESHPNQRDAWVADAERWIKQIHGVRQCKIDLDGSGEVTGVHVVAGMEREARHVVRDVEGLLKARLGLNVFYKKIGVVQVVDSEPDVGENGAPAPAPVQREPALDEPLDAVLLEEALQPRIQCGGVGLMASERSVKAEVELRAGLLEARGSEEGGNHSGSDMLLVARAAVAAVRQLLDEPVVLNLSDIRVATVGGEDVVLAAVELVEGRRSERLYGTCPARHNRQQAVVYAVLDALNRRVSLLAFKSAGR